MSEATPNLFAKYDIPVPRYTSYPTVPYWQDNPTSEQWLASLRRCLSDEQTAATWSAYLHIPFCETLCTFCGCNTVITKNHKLEVPYINSVLREQEMYFAQVPELSKKSLSHLHLGGGTPTFLTAENLRQLLEPLLKRVKLADNFEASIEVDPRRTHKDQLVALKELGFQRLSLGVQDFNVEVQRLINRHQSWEQTKLILDLGRQLNYSSINFDLIYGLPGQSPESLLHTMQQTVELQPDRIALYSFAMVPWIKPQQRLFKDSDIPQGKAKRDLYEVARGVLLNNGYVEIGMDHFALKAEALSTASTRGELHRNFMGYTDKRTDALVGWGVSSISETPDCYHQNEKVLAIYESRLSKGELPTHRGHLLNDEDQLQKKRILELMTKGRLTVGESELPDLKLQLSEFENDRIINWNLNELSITELGKPFLRNVCANFDLRLQRKKKDSPTFSQSL